MTFPVKVLFLSSIWNRNWTQLCRCLNKNKELLWHQFKRKKPLRGKWLDERNEKNNWQNTSSYSAGWSQRSGTWWNTELNRINIFKAEKNPIKLLRKDIICTSLHCFISFIFFYSLFYEGVYSLVIDYVVRRPWGNGELPINQMCCYYKCALAWRVLLWVQLRDFMIKIL